MREKQLIFQVVKIFFYFVCFPAQFVCFGAKKTFFASKCHIMVGNRQTDIFLKKMKTLNALDAFPYPECYKRTISGDFMII